MRERLIGALVLVAIVVLFVPAILKGRDPSPVEPPSQPTRRIEVPIGVAEPQADEQVLVPEPVPAAPPAIADAPPAKPVANSAKAAEREEESGAADSEGRDSPAKPATPMSPPGPTQSPSAAAPKQSPAWAVQLGAFSNRAKAEQLVAELRERRYSAFVLEYRATGQVLYRVRVGPEQDRARAEEIAARLSKDGFQPVVARHP